MEVVLSLFTESEWSKSAFVQLDCLPFIGCTDVLLFFPL